MKQKSKGDKQAQIHVPSPVFHVDLSAGRYKLNGSAIRPGSTVALQPIERGPSMETGLIYGQRCYIQNIPGPNNSIDSCVGFVQNVSGSRTAYVRITHYTQGRIV